jgi:hypothetical protein
MAQPLAQTMAQSLAGTPAQTPPDSSAAATKPVLILPTDDAGMTPPKPAGAALLALESAAFPLGLHIGMTPEEVNDKLLHKLPSVADTAMTVVSYLGPATVEGLSVGMADVGDLKPAITACFAPASRVVFQFVQRKLYAISFRFARDSSCPGTAAAADQLYQRLLGIPYGAMPSDHYRIGPIDVVDAWDPTQGSVVRQRWRP